MSFQIYNTLSRKKEVFAPLTPGQVKMYCCGPTVYGLLHVGNFRGSVVYNLLRNWLEKSGYQVTYAFNFTDVDDKIIAVASKEGVEASEISERYIAAFREDFAGLKLRAHDLNPRVTEHMQGIIEMVQDLITKSKAYVVDGEVLYSIQSFEEYGKLSHRRPEDLKAGVRIEVDAKKRDPLDFALWKPAKSGEPAWPSPWGPGRPGWHIECSAMAKALLGESIDIHGGGMDLIFPHHENEIAQSEACSGHPFVKYWVHNNMINFSGQKMSKSVGNIQTMRDFLRQYNAEIYKYLIHSAHYRSTMDFSETSIHNSIAALARIYSSLAVAKSLLDGEGESQKDPAFQAKVEEVRKGITEALNDDLNTPEVLARLFELVRFFNAKFRRGQKVTAPVRGAAEAFVALLTETGEMMALFQEDPEAFLTTLDDMLLLQMKLSRDTVDALVAERSQAREARDFKKSDEIRDQLLKMGIAVCDTASGSTWEVAK